MVLAAGLGERMRPLTLTTPKPLLAVGGRSMIDRALDRIEEAGVAAAVVNLHYLGEQIETHLRSRQRPSIRFSWEEERLETGGGVKRALPLLGTGPFFVINSDSIWLDGPTPALKRLAARWDPAAMDMLLLVTAAPLANDYDGAGDFVMDPVGRLRFRKEREIAPLVFAGVSMMTAAGLDATPDGAFSLRQVWQRAAASGRLYGVVHDGAWFHVGTPEALTAADPMLDPERARWLDT